MKLSKKQIQQVELYLTKRGLKYIDVRYEVLDHIVTDIEHLINTKNLSFEKASKQVYIKWNPNFYSTSSFWIGLAYSGPKIFIDNCVRIYKNSIIKVLFLTFIFVYAIDYLLNHISFFQINSSKLISIANYTLILLNISIILYWYYKIKRTKQKTSFSFLFVRQVLPSILMLLLFGLLNLVTSNYKLIIIATFISSIWSGWIFYKNHLKSVSRYSSISTI